MSKPIFKQVSDIYDELHACVGKDRVEMHRALDSWWSKHIYQVSSYYTITRHTIEVARPDVLDGYREHERQQAMTKLGEAIFESRKVLTAKDVDPFHCEITQFSILVVS